MVGAPEIESLTYKPPTTQTKEAPNGVKLYIYTEIQTILFINF